MSAPILAYRIMLRFLVSSLLAATVAACGDALPNSPNGPPHRDRVTVKETPNERGRLERIHGELILFTQGTPYEEGFQHGSLLKDELQTFYHDYYEQHVFPALPIMPAWWHIGSARAQAVEYTAEERAEIKGLADGSGLSEDQVRVMQAHPPWSAPATWLGASEAGRLAWGRTAFAVSGSATLGRIPLLGANVSGRDADVRHRFTLLQVHHPDRGYAFVVPTVVGRVMEGGGGWNERGLCLAANEGFMRWQNASGVTSGLLTRRLIQGCGTLEEADHAIRSVKRRSLQGLILLVATRAEARRFDVSQTVTEAWQGRDRLQARPGGPDGVLWAGNSLGKASSEEAALVTALRSAHGRIDTTKALEILVQAASGEASASFRLGPWPLDALGPSTTVLSTLHDLDHDQLYLAQGRSQLESPAQYVSLDVPGLLVATPHSGTHEATGTVAVGVPLLATLLR